MKTTMSQGNISKAVKARGTEREIDGISMNRVFLMFPGYPFTDYQKCMCNKRAKGKVSADVIRL